MEESADKGIPESLDPRPVPPLPAGQLDQGVDNLRPQGLAGRIAIGLSGGVAQGRSAEFRVISPDIGQSVPPLHQHVIHHISRRSDLAQVVERLGH